MKALFGDGPLTGLFQPDTILQDDLHFRAMLDDSRVCVVELESNVSDMEVRQQRYRDDLLKVAAGVAHVYNIPVDLSVWEVFQNHSEIALTFFVDHFVPSVVIPLDHALVHLSKNEEH